MSRTHAYICNPHVLQERQTVKVNFMSENSVLPRLTPEQHILKHLEAHGTPIAWLARKIGTSRPNLHLMLKGEGSNKRTLAPEYRDKINQILKTNY
jgi:hypothetical protein